MMYMSQVPCPTWPSKPGEGWRAGWMFDPSAHRILWIFPTFFVSCVSHVFPVSVALLASVVSFTHPR